MKTGLWMILMAAAAPVAAQSNAERTFAQDVEFMSKHTGVIVLGDVPHGPRVALAPAYQGRVMTSTADGARPGYGWLNDELIASGKTGPHINVWGGEDRFWLGPEGGQYAIFFSAGDKFDLEHWQTPTVIDTEAYDVVEQSVRSATFRKNANLTNYSGTQFTLQIDRTVRLLDSRATQAALGLAPGPGTRWVGYESENRITNTGKEAWTRENGLLSVWILGMFKPGPRATVVVPFRAGPEAELGPIVNDRYFGKVPADRLRVEDGVLFFKGDGQMRSKIGVGPRRAKPICGSYDPQRGVLTIVQYTLPADAADQPYVNSMWEQQEQPYAGDVVNSYNDGAATPGGKPFGPFYELETSSPAAALAPGNSLTHTHRTFHFEGATAELDIICQATLGVTLARVNAAFSN